MKCQGSHTKMKTALSQKEREAIKERVKDQLRAIHPKLQRPTDKGQQMAIRHNPELLKPKWYREITKHLIEAALPHCRRGSDAYRKGRDDGYFLGSLLRDRQAAEQQKSLRSKGEYLRQLKEDITACEAEKEKCLAELPTKERRDFARGFARGLDIAQRQLASENMYDSDLEGRLWNRMPAVLTRCRTIPELFQWLYGRPARKGRDWDDAFLAFQKYCQRHGIKVRPPGRPRKF